MTDLPTHKSECPSCHNGVDKDACTYGHSWEDVSCPECPECSDCDGAGKVTLSWHHEETTTCHGCSEKAYAAATKGLTGRAYDLARLAAWRALPEVPCDCYGEDGEQAICLPCALALHAAVCGCELWPKEAP